MRTTFKSPSGITRLLRNKTARRYIRARAVPTGEVSTFAFNEKIGRRQAPGKMTPGLLSYIQPSNCVTTINVRKLKISRRRKMKKAVGALMTRAPWIDLLVGVLPLGSILSGRLDDEPRGLFALCEDGLGRLNCLSGGAGRVVHTFGRAAEARDKSEGEEADPEGGRHDL